MLARIRTNFPEEVSEVCEALIEAGYVVETVRPDEFRIAPADLELTVDKLPVVEAWRRIPNTDTVYVAPNTPVSHDVRSALTDAASHSSLRVRVRTTAKHGYVQFTHWAGYQFREARARMHEIRQRWTPPREYHAPVHLEPSAPSSLEDRRNNADLEKSRLELVRRNDEVRRRQELEKARAAEQARQMEENRRRAREAAEAKVLLEKQQKIEAMVKATEVLRERVVTGETGRPQPVQRRRPRALLRTRRDRAFFRAGVTAFALSMGLAVLAGEALHPVPASEAVPKTSHAANQPPFPKPEAAPSTAAQAPLLKAPVVAPEVNPGAVSTGPVTAALHASAKPAHRSAATDDAEVVVRKPLLRQPRPLKTTSSVAHYSDLD